MAVVQNGEKWDFTCDVPNCGWSSREWPEETMATARGEQHYNEHITGEPAMELIEFERSVGFTRDAPQTTTVIVGGSEWVLDANGNPVSSSPVGGE